MSRRVRLEVIVSTVDDARAACDAGAHRAEVVSRLDEDGLTPSRAVVAKILLAEPENLSPPYRSPFRTQAITVRLSRKARIRPAPFGPAIERSKP